MAGSMVQCFSGLKPLSILKRSLNTYGVRITGSDCLTQKCLMFCSQLSKALALEWVACLQITGTSFMHASLGAVSMALRILNIVLIIDASHSWRSSIRQAISAFSYKLVGQGTLWPWPYCSKEIGLSESITRIVWCLATKRSVRMQNRTTQV